MSRPGNTTLRNQDPEARLFWQRVMPNWALGEAIFFAAERKIADAIGDGPTDLDEIARITGSQKDSLRRLLNALAVNGIFERLEVDRYAPTPLSEALRSDAAQSQRAYMSLGRSIIHKSWNALSQTMDSGLTGFEVEFGAPLFDYLREHPDLAEQFADGMTDTTRRAELALTQAALFGQFQTAVDIGGSFGSLLRLLLSKNPSATGIVLDRPEIAEQAIKYWRGAPDAPRLQAIGGNFFDAVPAGADLYILKQILHDWPDEQCLKILRNVRKAMGHSARLYIIEMVLPDDGTPHPGWMSDLMMMVVTGGRERTRNDYAAMLSETGLRLERVIETDSPLSVIEARPSSDCLPPPLVPR